MWTQLVHSPKDLLYVGWTDPGEWFDLTVNVKESGLYNVSLLYTSKNGGAFSLDVDGKSVGGLITIDSTYNALDLSRGDSGTIGTTRKIS